MFEINGPPILVILTTGVVYLAAIIAAVTDVRTGKVPNWLTVPALLVGLGLNVGFLGLGGLKASLIGTAIGISIWFIMPIIGTPLGGGDVKLLAAIGALRGPQFLLYVLVLSCLWAGLLALAMAAHRRRVIACARQVGQWLFHRVVTKTYEPLETAAPGLRVPFAAATGLGVLTATMVLYGSLLAG